MTGEFLDDFATPFTSNTATQAITVLKNYDVLPLIERYPSQLNQAFMDILVNAIEALEDKIQNDQLHSDNYTICIKAKLINNNSIEVRIIDNSLGIDKTI